MVAQVAITGSGTPSVSAAHGSAAAKSFTDLLHSIVQSPASTSAAADAAPSASAAAPTLPSSGNDLPQPGAADAKAAAPQQATVEQPAAPEESTQPDSVPSVASSAPEIPGAAEIADTPAATKVAGKSAEEKQDVKNGKSNKDEEADEPSASLTLLSLIPVTPPAVVPVRAETSSEDGNTKAGTSDTALTGTAVAPVSQKANTAQSATQVQQDPAQQGFSDALATANDEANSAAHLNVPSEAEDKIADKAVQAAVEQAIKPGLSKAANEAAAESTVSPSKAAATESADSTPQQQAASVNSASAVSEPKVTAPQSSQKPQPVQGARTSAERAKERASSRQAEGELDARTESNTGAQLAPAAVDSNAVSALQGNKGAEPGLRHDVPMQAASHDAQVVRESGERSGDTDSSASLQRAAGAASSAVHSPDQSAWMSSVRLMERISQSEMRVGIQSELGDIAVRTAMNHHELSAEISVQHAGLRDAIVAEIPTLQSRLSAQQIPMTNVSVTADAGGNSGGFHQSAQDGRHMAHYSSALNNNDFTTNEHEPAAPVESLGRNAGLDIRI